MRSTKNSVKSPIVGLRFNFDNNLAFEPSIFIDLYGNSFDCLTSLEEANDLELTLKETLKKVKVWKKKLKYKTQRF